MRTTLLSLSLFGMASACLAQPCTPNPLYADSVFGVWPDTITNFMDGMVNVFYSDTMNLIVPTDAGEIDPQFAGVALDSVQLNAIVGMPPGVQVFCNSQTNNSCTYLTGVLGCGLLEGTPTQVGTFPLTIDVTAFAVVFGSALPIPYEFTGYSITIGPNTVGITENKPLTEEVSVAPNPFSERTIVTFDLERAGTVEIVVHDILGGLVRSSSLAGKQGVNRWVFDAQGLGEGIYLYTVRSGAYSRTGRMVIT
ncbi:MAG: T9SS type A sorting domain-containing protein, partial [Flavobacteriales bacterium]|nr:T9SS type A sorting domain-containing protein [Flavobacteriales bacterium]